MSWETDEQGRKHWIPHQITPLLIMKLHHATHPDHPGVNEWGHQDPGCYLDGRPYLVADDTCYAKLKHDHIQVSISSDREAIFISAHDRANECGGDASISFQEFRDYLLELTKKHGKFCKSRADGSIDVIEKGYSSVYDPDNK